MASIPKVVTIDFETKGIEPRPNYPPVPVGVSIKFPSGKPLYYAWGHREGNNCTLAEAKRALKCAWGNAAIPSGGLLFHNAKFDYDVATTHMGMKELPWHQIHDTLFLLFLNDPHAWSLSLKPSAAKLLDMPPEEQDLVKDWILSHKGDIEARTKEKVKPSEFGKFICEAPAKLVGPYANGDTLRTEKLFKFLYPKIVAAKMLGAYDRERELMPILLRNEREGLRIDADLLCEDIARYEEAQLRAEQWLENRLKCKGINFDSDVEVGNALDKSGVVTEWVLTKTGKRSTSKVNMTVDLFKDKRVAAALGFRNRLTTCLGTFMRPWAAMAVSDGRIHTNWNQVRNSDSGKGARTGRLTCNPNFQNMPVDWHDKDDGYVHPNHIQLPHLPLIRQYILPDERGHVICKRDYNQQEFRLTAHFEDGKLMRGYIENPNMDVHQFVMDEIETITGRLLNRRPVKIINFGMLYGEGVGSLAERMGTDMRETKALKRAHKRALPDVWELDKSLKEAGRNGEPIRTLGGRLYYCEEPLMINGRMVTWEYKLLNYLMQGSAADQTKQAIINYEKLREMGRFMLTVHDELDSSAPKKHAKREQEILAKAMDSIPLDVPVLSDGKTGPNWAACE